MSAIANVSTTLSADVAKNGTVTFSYPKGVTQDMLQDETDNSVVVSGNVYHAGEGVTIAFGADAITVTNTSDITWPKEAKVFASFGRIDIKGSYNLTFPKQVQDKALADNPGPDPNP